MYTERRKKWKKPKLQQYGKSNLTNQSYFSCSLLNQPNFKPVGMLSHWQKIFWLKKKVMLVVYLKIRKFSQGLEQSGQVESRSKPRTWLDISLYFVRLLSGLLWLCTSGVPRVVFAPILFYMASLGQHPSNTTFNLNTNLGRKFCCTWATEILRESEYTTTWLEQ